MHHQHHHHQNALDGSLMCMGDSSKMCCFNLLKRTACHFTSSRREIVSSLVEDMFVTWLTNLYIPLFDYLKWSGKHVQYDEISVFVLVLVWTSSIQYMTFIRVYTGIYKCVLEPFCTSTYIMVSTLPRNHTCCMPPYIILMFELYTSPKQFNDAMVSNLKSSDISVTLVCLPLLVVQALSGEISYLGLMGNALASHYHSE